MQVVRLWLAGLVAGQAGACLALALVVARSGREEITLLDAQTLAITLLGSAVASLIGWTVFAAERDAPR